MSGTVYLTYLSYAIYLTISVAMTIFVARALRTHGRPFLIDTFHGDEVLADAVNRLLVIGFYLVNLGFVSVMLATERTHMSIPQAIALLSEKIGSVLLVVGAAHFANLLLFSRLRRARGRARA